MHEPIVTVALWTYPAANAIQAVPVRPPALRIRRCAKAKPHFTEAAARPRLSHAAAGAAGRPVRAMTRASDSRSRLRIVPDAFEQELLTDITEAEALGEGELAAEWRLELKTYRAAKKQAILEDQARSNSSAVARRETLGRRRSDQR